MPHGIKVNGLWAVIFESSCLKEPAAAFRGLENKLEFFLLKFLNFDKGK